MNLWNTGIYTSILFSILISSCAREDKVRFTYFDKFEGNVRVQKAGHYVRKANGEMIYFLDEIENDSTAFKILTWKEGELLINLIPSVRVFDTVYSFGGSSYKVSSFLLDRKESVDDEEYYFLNDEGEIILCVAVNDPISSHFIYEDETLNLSDSLFRHLSETNIYWPRNPSYWKK